MILRASTERFSHIASVVESDLEVTVTCCLRDEDVMELICLSWVIRFDNIARDSLARHSPPRAVLDHLDLLIPLLHLFPYHSVRLGDTANLDAILPQLVKLHLQIPLLLLRINYFGGVVRNRLVRLVLVLDIDMVPTGGPSWNSWLPRSSVGLGPGGILLPR